MTEIFANNAALQTAAFTQFGSQNLSGELQTIKRQLSRMATQIDRALDRAEDSRAQPGVSDGVASFLEFSLKAETVRRSMLEGDITASDPSWTILIRLIQARLNGTDVTSKELGMANEDSRFWLNTLELRGLAKAVHHPGELRGTAYVVTQRAYNLFLACCTRDQFDEPASCAA